MKTDTRDVEVIVKLIQDTRQKKLIWVKHNKSFLDTNKLPITSIAALLEDPVDGVYIASYKERYFQFYKTISPIQSYVLQLSSPNSREVDKEFNYSTSMKDLYLAIKEQESGLDSFLDDFLKN